MRHTLTAQVLARAVKNLYPESKLAIGPTIADGFYYDFEFKKAISPDDLASIEKEMRTIISNGSSITKTLHSKSEAMSIFKGEGETYKESIIEESDQELITSSFIPRIIMNLLIYAEGPIYQA